MNRAARIMSVLAPCAVLVACGGNSPSTAPTPSRPTQRSPASPPSETPTAPQRSSASVPSETPTQPSSPPPATEFNPPGDIPDNQVFVDYRAPGSSVRIKVPEGWPRRSHGGVTIFTDHYNSIAIQVLPMSNAPTRTSARHSEVPGLRRSVSKFALQQVSSIHRQHGTAVLVTYLLDSAPNQVTGKVVRDAAERYEFWHAGQEAVLTLTGPKGADNVDPWRLVSDSLHWA